MLKKFESIAHSKEFGYAYDSQAFDVKAPILDHFRMFQTYGDGLCQHSGDWSVTSEHLTDYLASLAVAMLADEELTEQIAWNIGRRPSLKQIRFAASIIWKEGKRKYYNLSEMKISGHPDKQYDKRYKEIEPYHDGTAAVVYSMLIPEYADGLQRYAFATAVRDYFLEDGAGYMELIGEFLKWTTTREDARKLRDAFEACERLTAALEARHRAQCAIENYRRSLPQPKTAEEVQS